MTDTFVPSWTAEDVTAYRVASRAAQGLPPMIEDARTLDRLALIARLASSAGETSTSTGVGLTPAGVEISAARSTVPVTGTAACRAAENVRELHGDDVDLTAGPIRNVSWGRRAS